MLGLGLGHPQGRPGHGGSFLCLFFSDFLGFGNLMVFPKGLVFVVSEKVISSQNIEICSHYSHLSVGSGGAHSASRRPPDRICAVSVVPTFFLALSKCEYTIGIALKFCTSLYPISYVSDENLKNLILNFFFQGGIRGPLTPHIHTFSHSELFFGL